MTKARPEVAAWLRGYLVDQQSVPPEDIHGGARFEDLAIDSLEYVETLMAAEEHFRIEITDEEGRRLSTVRMTNMLRDLDDRTTR